MNINNVNTDIYIGLNAGEEIYNTILNAKKSIAIVSPYLSANYVDLLVQLQEKGIDVTLLSNSDCVKGEGNQINILKKCIEQKQTLNEEADATRKKGILVVRGLILLLVLFNIFSVYDGSYTSLYSLFLLLILLPLGSYYKSMKIFNYTYNYLLKPIFFASYHEQGKRHKMQFFIHSKIFIIDDEVCFLGSANFTLNAFRRNYESVIKITDKDKIDEIKNEISNLPDREGTYTLDYDKIIPSIYMEPAN